MAAARQKAQTLVQSRSKLDERLRSWAASRRQSLSLLALRLRVALRAPVRGKPKFPEEPAAQASRRLAACSTTSERSSKARRLREAGSI